MDTNAALLFLEVGCDVVALVGERCCSDDAALSEAERRIGGVNSDAAATLATFGMSHRTRSLALSRPVVRQ